MNRLRTPALLKFGTVAVLLGGLLLVACQSSLAPGASSTTSAPTTAGSSTTTAPSGTPSTPTASDSTTIVPDVSLGKIIFTSGADATGHLIPRSGVTGMMGSIGACADCHGSDARGNTVQMMMGQLEAPDIRWSTLTAPPTDPTDKAFDPDSFFLAVTQGIDPTGAALKVFMPRWELTRAESDALIAYLKSL